MLQLLIVMPVYNEQASVRGVVEEWFRELEKWTPDFVFLAIDDGSTDNSAGVLRLLREQFGSRLEVLRQENRGHGQSCLRGYRVALDRDVPYVMQIDSDGQCDPRYFSRLWQMCTSCDVVYGNRTSRDDGWRRVLASLIVRAFLLVFFRVNCVDANVPYRIMRTPILGPILPCIAPDFVLANVALAVLLRKNPAIRQGSVPIGFRERSGGEPSVRLGRFADKAAELYRQLKSMLSHPAVTRSSGSPAGQNSEKTTPQA